MALFYPEITEIQGLKVKPEAGELHLLKFLEAALDDSFEVFFNPFLNGDRPDIIIMRKNYGVMIIEVKDWNLKNYFLDGKRKWRLQQNNSYIKSPIDQVLQYKENIYNLHLPNLLEKKIRNFKYWHLVSCAVYFHNAPTSAIEEMLVEPFEGDEKYLKFLKYNIVFLGSNSLNQFDFDKVLFSKYLKSNQESTFFSLELYDSFKRYFKPVWHTKQDGQKLNYSSKQKKLIQSKPREQRIKGVVGSGKTTVLAARAVDAHLRTSERVLILTYNITLKNYIHDKISHVREEFLWSNFYINNYHNFITSELNNLGVEFVIPEDFSKWSNDAKGEYFENEYYSNFKLFSERKAELPKYHTILIDEIQDYKRPWMDIIKDCFLEDGGEYILFGDEKQNIYDNELDNKDVKTNVQQRPSEMKSSFRSGMKIKDLAINFQRNFFNDKYDVDSFNIQTKFSFEAESNVNYLFLPNDSGVSALYNSIHEASIQLNEHPNDIAVLGFSIKLLRDLDCYYRYKSGEKTNAMFETQEVWFKLLIDEFKDNDSIVRGLALFKKVRDEEDKRSILAVCFTLKLLIKNFGDKEFKNKLHVLLAKYEVGIDSFTAWYDSKEVQIIASAKTSWKANGVVKNVRDNKKFHFWFNSGTLKISTIHSFKGWEANTLILIIEPRYDNGEFQLSFDELIYVGLTRSRSNLVVLNYGNVEYHKKLESLFLNQSP